MQATTSNKTFGKKKMSLIQMWGVVYQFQSLWDFKIEIGI